MNPQNSPNANLFSQPVDQQALNLTRSIALAETSQDGKAPNYNAVGDNGTSTGAYQWQPGNFESAAIAAGLNPNDKSPENQDKVAYAQVKGYKDKGYQPAEIASIWNSGQPNNWQNHAGTTIINGQPINYNTPAYVQKVKGYYGQLAAGATATSAPTTLTASQNAPAPTEPTLGSELQKRGSDIVGAVNQTASGQINPLSGALQVVGGVAGGVNDVVNKGLELIPGVKQLEGLLGEGVGKLAQTPVGQSVAQAISSFSKAHPELSSDIGAGFNIATAIPIFAGLGAVKDLAAGGAASVLRGVAEKGVTNDVTAALGRTVGGRALIDETTPSIIKAGLDAGAIPGVTAGKITVEEAVNKADAAIGKIAQDELQPLLDKVSTTQIADRVPLQAVRDAAKATAVDSLQDTRAIDTLFDRIQAKYGDFPSLAQLNKAKQLVSKLVPQRAFDLEGFNSNFTVRQSLQKAIEEGATKLGLGDVNAINGKMSTLYRYIEMLQKIDGKPLQESLLRKVVRQGVGLGVGGLIGNKLGGVPGEVLGGLAGEKASGLFARRNLGGLMSKLGGITSSK